MADKKISQLTAATTPLAGTEVLPIVQGSTTVKVPVNSLFQTADTDTSGLLSSTDWNTFNNKQPAGSYAAATNPTITGNITSNTSGYFCKMFAADTTTPRGYIYTDASGIQLDTQDIGTYFSVLNGGYETLRVTYSNVTLSHSNLVIGTSGKGIDFSATANGSGTMTSELLADYEEGTFTPTILGSITNPTVTYSIQRGAYTKIGSLVTVTLYVAWSALSGGSGYITLPMPFTTSGSPGTYDSGSMSGASGVTYPTGYIYVTPQCNSGTTEVRLNAHANGSGSAWCGISGLATGGGYIAFTISYRAS